MAQHENNGIPIFCRASTSIPKSQMGQRQKCSSSPLADFD
jgi:hypothetical protein